MSRTVLFIAIGLAVTLTATIGPARGAEPDVTPDLICRVQDAIRFREPAWTSAKCSSVAAELNTTSAPRTFTALAINESDLRERAVTWHGPRVADAGLTGIRCLLGKHRRCTNGPARGYTVAQLRRASINLRVANKLMATKGSLGDWNPRSKGYAERVRAIAAALDGERAPVKSARVQKLIDQIVAAVMSERNS